MIDLQGAILAFLALGIAGLLVWEWARCFRLRREEGPESYPLGRLARRTTMGILLEASLAAVHVTLGGYLDSAGPRALLGAMGLGIVSSLLAILVVLWDIRRSGRQISASLERDVQAALEEAVRKVARNAPAAAENGRDTPGGSEEGQ